jgi:hypothetical protein
MCVPYKYSLNTSMKFKTLEQIEIEHIRLVLSYYHFNKQVAAKVLGISDRGLRLKFNLHPELQPSEIELEEVEVFKDKISLWKELNDLRNKVRELENEKTMDKLKKR